MKKSVIVCAVVMLFSLNVFAEWALVSLDELVKDSDLIVIGTLQSVSEYSKTDTDYGEGKILVEKVIFGNVKTDDGFPLKLNDALQLRWQNSSFIVCPRIEHKSSENEKEIWLLNVEQDGTVRAGYPGRSVSLDELGEIKRLLRDIKKPGKVSKIVTVQESVKQTNQPSNVNSSPMEDVEFEWAINPSPKQYSVFSAFIVALISLGLYWMLYRSRFKIR